MGYTPQRGQELYNRYVKYYEIRRGWLDHLAYLNNLGVGLVLCSSIPAELAVYVGMILDDKAADSYFGTEELLPMTITRRSGRSLDYKAVAHNFIKAVVGKQGGRVQCVDDDPQVAYCDVLSEIPCFMPIDKEEVLRCPVPHWMEREGGVGLVLNQAHFREGIPDVVKYYQTRSVNDDLSKARDIGRTT